MEEDRVSKESGEITDEESEEEESSSEEVRPAARVMDREERKVLYLEQLFLKKEQELKKRQEFL